MLNVDPLTRIIISKIDGTRTIPQLMEYVGELASQGKLNISVKGDKQIDMTAVHRATIDKILEQLRKSALLV